MPAGGSRRPGPGGRAQVHHRRQPGARRQMSSSSGAEGGCPGQHRDDSIIRVLDIVNTRGLHARASAKFVQTVEKYAAQVRVTRGSETVGGTSIMGLMMLAAGPGTPIKNRASVPPAAQGLAARQQPGRSRVCGDE